MSLWENIKDFFSIAFSGLWYNPIDEPSPSMIQRSKSLTELLAESEVKLVKVKEENKALNARISELEEQNEQYKTECGKAAHDLNNKLAVILGNLEVALEDSPEEIKVFLNAAYESAEGLKVYGVRLRKIVSPRETAEYADNVSKAGPKDQYTVLVIEDEESLGPLVQNIVERLGYRCILARSGEDGIAAYKSEKPNVVITDMILPGIKGDEVLRQIKEIAPNIPVILSSGFSDSKQNTAYRYADGALDKPYTKEQLKKVLDSVLK